MKNEKVLNDEQTAQLVDCISLMEEPYHFDMNTTFGDMDGSALVFAGIERPFYRCLNLQARLARIVALKKGQSDASYDFPDFWSENLSLGDKMGLFQRSILEARAI
ncbi:hypothetical protein P3T76_000915 [Phytophthora citrophthora]|uniref:Uncharacterized protein n=1 Tax=Phytophthora citrophthora TaxID=4793 RepID=A0AAD9GYY3_9STRA|nr:hypothetical protein P3T76_000915 [Phytophthora citrophthora]